MQKQVDELKAAKSAEPAPVMAADVDAIVKEKDAEIDNMAAQVAWLHRRLDQANEDLEKANDELAQAEELVADIDKFEEIKQRKDEEISNLKKKLLQAGNDDSDLIDELKKKNEELEAKVEELTQLLNDAKSAEAANDAILDDLDAGIEFTGAKDDDEDDKDQMSLF